MLDFFELTPDLVCVASREGYLKRVNAAVISKLGYSREELYSTPISAFIHPDDRERTEKFRSRLLAGDSLLNFQNRYITKDARTIWLEWTSIYFSEREIVFAIAKDITARKEIELEVEAKYHKYKSLATHFKSSLEEEKKYLAAELHEELAQLASVIKLDIEWMRTNIPSLNDTAKEKVEHAYFLSDLLINTIQRISFSISPGMLHDLGLDAAIEWYCKEFNIVSGIECTFEGTYDESKLSVDLKMDLFRICQESLTSVRDLEHLQKIQIRISDDENKLALIIIAEGDHLDADVLKQKPRIARVRERVCSINGYFDIESDMPKRAKIIVTID